MHNFDARIAVDSSTATVTLSFGETVLFARSAGVWALSEVETVDHQLLETADEHHFLDARSGDSFATSLSLVVAQTQEVHGRSRTCRSNCGACKTFK